MNPATRQQFLDAGFRLYPQYGYRQLSVRLLAAETGLSPGMFHHLFANKDAFVGELLQQRYGAAFAELTLTLNPQAGVRDNLREVLGFVARFVRDHLPWIHRVFADSAEGVACVNDFIRHHGTRHVAVLMALVAEGMAQGLLPQTGITRYLGFLMGGIIEPMVVVSELIAADLAPQQVADEFAEHIISDGAIDQRIDWALAALFSPPVQEPI
ncbi:AcrR family transcriptional regulator [Neisseria sp. HSC-16F19]|nr:TetR/AcrR family transcriptional regulator [Neisseria sp. HSC-16F19]MCP2040735.1 AcrR family transcriptional regulator [Neisseria sp. HSC-16F19]